MNGTPKPTCTDSSWTGASAFWFLATLAIGCLSQPRGSLIFSQSGRIWRLSPIVLILEEIYIVIRLFQGLRQRGFTSKTLRIYCHVLLAIREGNAWQQKDYDKFVAENVHNLVSRSGEDDTMANLLASTDESALERASGDLPQDAPSSDSSIVRRTTATLEEGRVDGETHYSPSNFKAKIFDSLEDEWCFIKLNDAKDSKLTVEPETRTKINSILRERHAHNLRKIQDYEKGPTFRILLWFPMIQQICKAALVTGSPITQSIGGIYLFSFLLIEFVLYRARKPLQKSERAEALLLMLILPTAKPDAINSQVLSSQTGRVERRASEGLALDQATIHWLSATVGLIFARVLSDIVFGFGRITTYAPFYHTRTGVFFDLDFYYDGDSKLMSVLLFILIFPNLMGFILSLGLDSMILYFFCAYHVFLLGLPCWLSIWSVQFINYYSGSENDQGHLRLTPTIAALQTLLFAGIAYFGLTSADYLSYDCSTTTKRSFYDLLG